MKLLTQYLKIKKYNNFTKVINDRLDECCVWMLNYTAATLSVHKIDNVSKIIVFGWMQNDISKIYIIYYRLNNDSR